MEVVSTVAQLRSKRSSIQGSLGFVPTMGFLHEGHISLVDRARAENDRVAASIFVNPLQFGPKEDLASYPRDLPRDLAMLQGAGVDLVFTPYDDEVYQKGFSTTIEVGDVTERLEGVMRPGHFRGVATVVAKLLNMVQPDRAYFGQKDAQQCVVIQKMVRDLNMPLDIVVCPTVREPDGLAMSSRNTYLNEAERAAAPVLFAALRAAQQLYEAGERDGEALRRVVNDVIATEPLFSSVEYVSIADAQTLHEMERIDAPAIVSLAARLGRTRLIDNVLLH
jgi:pantoate--beta-alanine ligase